jgi:hypothetical protein
VEQKHAYIEDTSVHLEYPSTSVLAFSSVVEVKAKWSSPLELASLYNNHNRL